MEHSTTKKTMGRPPKKEKRTITYHVRMTPLEHQAFIQASKESKLTASDYIRNVLGSYTSINL
jgi:hypothetical protein